MEAVSTRSLLRSTAIAMSVPLLVVALWLVRGVTTGMSDAEVRHGVLSRAAVLAVDGDEATVRIVRPSDTVTTVINRHGDYAAGDTIRVVHDPVDPRRASELGAPMPSTALERGLVVGVPIALAALGAWWFLRRPPEGEADAPARADTVRGGRVLQTEPARSGG
jgi:hypothetical protein